MKSERHAQIIRLIEEYDIETQEELAARLVQTGYAVTQATVSRDIRQLRLTKAPKEGGGFRYVRSQEPAESGGRYERVLRDAYVSVDCARNLLVIKTVSGMGMAAAAALDNLDWSEQIGCIGGDDTILCVARDDKSALLLMERVRRLVEAAEDE